MEKKIFKTEYRLHNSIIDKLEYIVDYTKTRCFKEAVKEFKNLSIETIVIDTSKDMTNDIFYNDYTFKLYLECKHKQESLVQVKITAWN